MRLLKSFLFCFCLASLSLSAAVLVNPQRAYVVNQEDDTVSLISTSTDTLQSTPVFQGFDRPQSIAILSSGIKGYVTNADGGTVSVIDFVNNSVDHTSLTGFNQPWAIVATPDRKKVYVTNLDSSSVSVISVEANTVNHSVFPNSFNNPRSIAITPDGTKVFVSNKSGDSVIVINTKTDQIIRTLTGFDNPFGVAVTPDGTKAYVANQGSINSVSIIDVESLDVDHTSLMTGFDSPYYIAIVQKQGIEKAFVTNEFDNSLNIINLSNNNVTSIEVSDDPYAVAISADGTKVYVSSAANSCTSGEGGVDVIDTATNQLIKTITGFSFPTSIGVVPIVSVVPEVNYSSFKGQKGVTLKWLLAQ
ncbi:MAG: hypothetical protein S4CHLAM37_00610 [Chlamydiia bacterium]|nr:hypothetical protein [Chlamydiia bacterium]